ncbi:hypothetical protein WEU38_11895 [Cyanobacterium aponinum AL20118]|uniref:Uncharacterized protein n=1 Tax=Cyanobacterium aponinum AL20115 TaxID=3090662 RepID=A0AAF0ZER1_9CHRO|nr:hypothetical protein [Cyanobacterium aponinum]WPF87512.1 hypothetical protein SAY89_11925 [Cyanobacterium aponinum AL20115]
MSPSTDPSLTPSGTINPSIDPTSSIEPSTSCQPTAPNTTTSVLYLPGPDRANWDGVNYVNYRITDDGCTEVIEAQIDPVTAPTPEDVQVPDLPDITYNRTNFFSYAVDQWSNKFPFGIVGDFQGIAGSNTCPSWTFLGVQVTLCIVRDAIAILKYPAIIAFLVRTYHFA